MESTTQETHTDLTPDPQNWAALPKTHHTLGAPFEYQMCVRGLPVCEPVPGTTEALLSCAAPLAGLGQGRMVDEMMQHISPNPASPAHSRFWDWVAGTGTPNGLVTDMLAAGVTSDREPALSPGFRALNVWVQIREFGLKRLSRLHDQNVANTNHPNHRQDYDLLV